MASTMIPMPPAGGDGDGDDQKVITIAVPAGTNVIVTGAAAPEEAPMTSGDEPDAHLRELRAAALADEAHQQMLDRKIGPRLR